MSRRGRRSGPKRSPLPWVILALVVVTGVVGYYIFTQSGTAGGSSVLNNTPVSSTVLNYLSGVSMNTLSAVGSGGSNVNSPTAISNAPTLTLDGKPEVLYMGAEYCPYCAAQRWAMVVALDKFGTFTGIDYMQSSSTDIYPNTSTLTFVGATYSSNYIAFVTVEQTDRNQQALQTSTAAENALLTSYDKGGTIPFVDFANKYVITSSQYSPIALRVGGTASGAPYNWTQIASQLDNSSSVFAQNIDAAANRLISAICKIDGGQPASVCSQGFASLLGYAGRAPPGISQLILSDAVPSGQVSPTAPTRPTYWV